MKFPAKAHWSNDLVFINICRINIALRSERRKLWLSWVRWISTLTIQIVHPSWLSTQITLVLLTNETTLGPLINFHCWALDILDGCWVTVLMHWCICNQDDQEMQFSKCLISVGVFFFNFDFSMSKWIILTKSVSLLIYTLTLLNESVIFQSFWTLTKLMLKKFYTLLHPSTRFWMDTNFS